MDVLARLGHCWSRELVDFKWGAMALSQAIPDRSGAIRDRHLIIDVQKCCSKSGLNKTREIEVFNSKFRIVRSNSRAHAFGKHLLWSDTVRAS